MKRFLFTCCLFTCCLFAGLAANAQQKKINIRIDERVELVTAMQLLYGYPLVGRADIGYKKDVLNTFGSDTSDAAIKYFLKITQQYFSFVKPINYTLHYRLPDFRQTAGFSDYENIHYQFDHHADSLRQYIVQVRHFYTDRKFHRFFTSHRTFYDRIIRQVKPKVDSINLAEVLEKHYGWQQHSYTLILSPLFNDAGMSTWLETPQGKDLYSIIGPNSDSKDEPVFDNRWLIQYLVMHEFSHPFSNPLIDQYYPQLEKDSALFDPIRKAMRKEGTSSWKVTLCELLTRANEIELDRQVFGDADADAVYKNYLGKQYIYLHGLVPLIRKYKQHRDQYPTLAAIMPEIVKYFDDEASKAKPD